MIGITNYLGATMFLHITLPLAIQRLRALASAEPDRMGIIDPNNPGAGGCMYITVVDGVLKAVCIIGQFFADFGLLGLLATGFDENGSLLGQDGMCVLDSPLWDRLAAAGVVVDEDAKEFMRTVQVQQDNGNDSNPLAWGPAFDKAVSKVREAERKRIEDEVNEFRDTLTARSDYLELLANEPEPLLHTNPWDEAPWSNGSAGSQPF
jgi:hypothetical protein